MKPETRGAGDNIIFFDVADAPVRQRLKRVSPEIAAALNQLFSGRELVELPGPPTSRWRFTRTQSEPWSLLARIRGAQEELLMGISEDGLRESLGEREWWDYENEPRLLAWTLAHSLVIEGLGRLLREPLVLVGLHESGAHDVHEPPPGTLVLGFAVSVEDGRRTTGALCLSPEWVLRLAACTGWRPPAPDYGPWAALPGTLRVELAGMPFATSELAGSAIGDVLVLGRRAQCWDRLRVSWMALREQHPLQAWTAGYDGERITLKSALPDLSTERVMSEDPSRTSANTAPEVTLEHVPVTLDFDIGTLMMPLRELAGLKAGYVFKLPSRLEEARVVIRANGVKIGEGELVAVGDVLGVQLLSIETDGLR